MRLADLVAVNSILPQLNSSVPADVIGELGACLARRHEGVDAQEAVHALEGRERRGSTAVAGGLAIPHAKLGSVRELVACFARSWRGVDFGAPDGRPTHFFFALLAPECAPGEHLKTLARITRLFKRPELHARLMAARTARELHEVLASEDAA